VPRKSLGTAGAQIRLCMISPPAVYLDPRERKRPVQVLFSPRGGRRSGGARATRADRDFHRMTCSIPMRWKTRGSASPISDHNTRCCEFLERMGASRSSASRYIFRRGSKRTPLLACASRRDGLFGDAPIPQLL